MIVVEDACGDRMDGNRVLEEATLGALQPRFSRIMKKMRPSRTRAGEAPHHSSNNHSALRRQPGLWHSHSFTAAQAMEARNLFTAADRAMRSCSLLRSRLASLSSTSRSFSSTRITPQQQHDTAPSRAPSARWESAPPVPTKPSVALGQGRMPFKLRTPRQPAFRVPADDAAGNALLDGMYARLLGRGGELLLPHDVKWLAVTHKSFDHGWQGSNDRLALLGKRFLDVNVCLGLMNMPALSTWGGNEDVATGALGGLENVTPEAKSRVAEKRRVAALARQVGVGECMRWKPRNTTDLQSSGVDTVLAHTLYAIIGALTLHRGGNTTLQLVKERILTPLGLKV
ncbi:hypothetical protein ANO11243_019340 [Dothideomycetidae sp. 11243]|nr:hypothetical protein ANO11243_019340 [fungal sp. No.11243]